MFLDFDHEGLVTCGGDNLLIVWKVSSLISYICLFNLKFKTKYLSPVPFNYKMNHILYFGNLENVSEDATPNKL